MVVKWS